VTPRRTLAHIVARDIERFDNCAVLSEASLTAIERAIAEYAVDRLVSLRERLVSLTLDAREKARCVDEIDALIREELA
jgi:hypothetical protein